MYCRRPAGDGWGFMEGRPAGGGETLGNPCDKWFCSKTKGYGTGTRVFAAHFTRSSRTAAAAGVSFPMAWEPDNRDVPGEDRSEKYTNMCGKC